MPTKSQRWLDLLALLLGRTIPLTVEEIMDRVPAYAEKWNTDDPTKQDTARRTFERDKDELRAAGIPLDPVNYGINAGAETIEGYRIRHGDFYLPYLRLISADGQGTAPPKQPYAGLASLDLSTAEAELALEALRRVADLPAFPFAPEARSALLKLQFDIDPERFPGDPVLWVDRPGSREVLERLRALSDALLARKRIAFTYHGIHRGSATEREVEPYGLFFQRDWYLVARDPAAEALRIFRVSRMDELRPNARAPKSPDFVIPGDFTLQEYLDRSAWELGQEEQATTADVRFRFPLSLQAARNGEGELLREEDDGSAIRTFRVSRPNPFLRWILSLGGEAEILSPPTLREALEEMARQVLALYPEEAAHG
jgi:proteasome accessory factor B